MAGFAWWSVKESLACTYHRIAVVTVRSESRVDRANAGEMAMVLLNVYVVAYAVVSESGYSMYKLEVVHSCTMRGLFI